MPIRSSRFLFAILIVGLVAISAFGEGTHTWEQSKFDDLVKGTAKGVAIRSAGGLELAPAFKPLYTTPSTYIWAIASDDQGTLYAAAGAPARIYRIAPGGNSTIIFEPKELQVQALVVDKSGIIYAATSPDGKVYKLDPKTTAASANAKPDSLWSSNVLFDPDSKYIWDLALDKTGSLYVATGDRGEIYRVTSKGEHSLFFKSDEAHIRVLAFDPAGNLIAGSDGSGLIYRISPAGEAFVLYSAPKKEITALAIDKRGSIYAAAVGEKHPGSAPTSFPISVPLSMPSSSSTTQGPGLIVSTTIGSSIPTSLPSSGTGASGGSDIYKIAPDGSPTRLWTSREDIVYALAFNQKGALLAGTGNRGHIFAVMGEDEYTDLIKASGSQITAFAAAPGGGLYAATSNLGKLFVLGPNPESEGTYEGDIFDAHIFSRWGRIEFRGAGNVELQVRSGNVDNPDRNWSTWKKVDWQKNAAVEVPSARFIQWKAVLRSGNPEPAVDSVVLNYLPKNVAPDIDDVTVQVGMRYPSTPKAPDINVGGAIGSMPHYESPSPAAVHDRDSIAVKWTVHDDNDDQMVYSVYYRGDGESRWLLLKDGLNDKFYSFDADFLPDSGYNVKVVASDAASHSPEDALTAEKESPRFEVDTTPPQVENLAAALDVGRIHVTFRAVDGFSPIKRAEYSLDANDWQFVEPVGQISDSRSESYDFRVAVPSVANSSPATAQSLNPQMEHVVVVRAYDRYDNVSAAKVIIGAK